MQHANQHKGKAKDPKQQRHHDNDQGQGEPWGTTFVCPSACALAALPLFFSLAPLSMLKGNREEQGQTQGEKRAWLESGSPIGN